LANLAKVSTPAFTNASAAFGPAPSINLRSSALADFLAAGFFALVSALALGSSFLVPGFTSALALVSFLGASFFACAFASSFLATSLASFLGAAFSVFALVSDFLSPEAKILSIIISVKDCL